MNRNTLNPATGLSPVQQAMIYMPLMTPCPQHIAMRMMRESDEYKEVVLNNPSLRGKENDLWNKFAFIHGKLIEEITIQADIAWRLRMVNCMFDLTEGAE